MSVQVLRLTSCSSVAECQSATAEAEEAFGRIDVLLLCNSEALFGTIEELGQSSRTQSLVTDQFATNFFGPVNIIKAHLPILRAQRSGHIVLLTGISKDMNAKSRQQRLTFASRSRSSWHTRTRRTLCLTVGNRRLLRQPRIRDRALQHSPVHRPKQYRDLSSDTQDRRSTCI